MSSFVKFFEYANGVRRIQLTRSRALNVLNTSMLQEIQAQVLQWKSDQSPLLILDGDGKAFCAGGDVKALAEQVHPVAFYEGFFQAEYSLDHLLYHLPFPSLAIWDGFTMGGGVGYSVSATYRIVTDKTVFAMPECAIGLFPDVGASYFLNHVVKVQREPHQGMSLFLALTGERLNAADCLYSSLATHFIPSGEIESFKKDLTQLTFDSNTSALEDVLQQYQAPPLEPSKVAQHIDTIDRCFGTAGTIEEILRNLEQETSDWARQMHQKLLAASPTSLKITLEQLKRGQQQNVTECFEMEYTMALRCMPGTSHHDFKEGVTALLIDKGRSPNWKPEKLEQVTPAMVQQYFQPFESRQPLHVSVDTAPERQLDASL